MAATAFGLGTPIAFPAPSPISGGPSSYGVSVNPFMVPQVFGQSPVSLTQGTAFNPYATHPLQQIQQVLQIVPQQLQQLLQLEYLQHQQVQQLQQLLQSIPAQLAQAQQLIQGGAQHLQPFQQPFGTVGLPLGAPWGLSPQIGAPPSYVM